MKKSLLATTFLVATAGFAAAEVTVSGSARFGIVDDGTDTYVDNRMTFNFDARKETDSGVVFGGRIRMRYDESASYTYGGSPAMLYAEANGFRLEVGNANGAYDSAGLMWNSEVGLQDTSYGDPNNTYYGYFYSKSYNNDDQMGIFLSYSMGDFTARISHHVYDQFGLNTDSETSVSVDWSSNGFSVSAAHVDGSAGWTEDTTFVGVAYAIGDSTNVGLNYFTGEDDDLITLYANHTLANGLTLSGYVADQDGEDTAFGLGASYDLGGASLVASYEERGADNRSSLGVKFGF